MKNHLVNSILYGLWQDKYELNFQVLSIILLPGETDREKFFCVMKTGGIFYKYLEELLPVTIGSVMHIA